MDMKILYFFSLIISSTLIMSSHPVAILATILIQTFILCLMIWFVTKNSWLAFILFIIFLGGLMVLFIYITSMASNEKFETNVQTTIMWMLISMMLILTSILYLFFELSTTPESTNLFKIIMYPFLRNNILITMLIMIYLLVTLIVAVKISNKYEGPLRNVNFK